MEDSTLPGSRLNWWSSIDRYLGSASFTSTVGLSTGNHVITLRATDWDGMGTEVEHSISVLSGTDPKPGLPPWC
ncbi:MAG: hypothetical protein PVG11_10670 [Anaerolineae bacterium]|jgi:hypothetical protein